MNNIKPFKSFFNRNNSKLIDNILDIQGTPSDQRPVNSRIIYTKKDLDNMSDDEILNLYRCINHPRGGNW